MTNAHCRRRDKTRDDCDRELQGAIHVLELFAKAKTLFVK